MTFGTEPAEKGSGLKKGVNVLLKRIKLPIFFLISLFLIILGCGGGGGGTLPSTAALISISVTPANPSVPVQVTQQFAAFGTYSDGTSRDITTQTTWSSSSTSVATVNSSGLATPVAAGTATITATSGSISGSTTLTVISGDSGGTIRLAWDPNTAPNLAGYRVYYGPASGVYSHSTDVGNVTTYILTGLTKGQTYSIAVTAYDTSNNESGYSNEVSGVAK